jgi:hypothetical protein
MKKYFIFAAIAALVMSAGCSKNETYVSVTDQEAVTFGAYSGRTITKAGPTEDMNLDSLKTLGFGVFATYTGTDAFEDAANDAGATDDFMYNQQVTYSNPDWVYSPVKYWPNPTNGQTADAQKVSFFAYAPYANPEAAAADNTYGITGFSKAVANDDPNDPSSPTHLHNFVNYKFSKDKPNVDLMWGYKTKNIDTTDPLNPVVTYTVNNNLTRSTNTVHFKFQHLLAKLGGSWEGTSTYADPADDPAYVANGLVVKANAETVAPTNDFGTATGTKITISKIVIGSAPEVDAISGLPVTDIDGNNISYAAADMTGKLDLYTGVFTLDGAAQNIQFKQTITNLIDDPATTTYDESNPDSEIANRLKEPATVTDFASLPVGVTATAVNVYQEESNPIILVPGTKPVVDVEISYIVRTYDEKLGTKKYSEVPQTVWGRIKFAEIKKNTKYNIVMILGLNDVKFSAEVEDWEIGTNQVWNDANGNGVVDAGEMVDTTNTEIGLPSNL